MKSSSVTAIAKAVQQTQKSVGQPQLSGASSVALSKSMVAQATGQAVQDAVWYLGSVQKVGATAINKMTQQIAKTGVPAPWVAGIAAVTANMIASVALLTTVGTAASTVVAAYPSE